MYLPFKITADDIDYGMIYNFELYTGIDREEIRYNIEKIICDDIILGDILQDKWFPEFDADVFVSHSHQDEELVIGFANWLYDEFNLKVFVDSMVWGYADNLIDKLKSHYDERIVSQHVYNMLNAALHNMIDKSEAFIFVDSNNSTIRLKNEIQSRTLSPWLYSELECVRTIRRKSLPELRHDAMLYESNESVKISYPISTKSFLKLTRNDLNEWYNNFHKNPRRYLRSALDALYNIKKQK